MAYVKPGVEIKQVQASATPILNPADLPSVVVGPGYYVHPYGPATTSVGGDSYYTYSGTALEVDLSNSNASYNTIDSPDESLAIVDLVGKGGSAAGTITHLSDSQWSISGSKITIDASIGSFSTTNTAEVHVSYRTLRTDLNSYQVINSTSEISTKIGDPVSYNPLAFGVSVAMSNAGSAIGAYGIPKDAADSVAVSDYESAMDDLLLNDVYAIAPAAQIAGLEAAMKTKVEAASVPAVKKERIAITNTLIPTTNGKYRNQGGTENKANVAGDVRDANAAFSKRVVRTHPDIAYIIENRHVNTLKVNWIAESFANAGVSQYSATGLDEIDAYAKFTGTTNVGTKTYYYGDNITDAIVTELIAAGVTEMNAFVPVPGWAYSAAVAGQSAGLAPEQPFTNMPVAGLLLTHGSQDHFIEADLNTMAGGGAYVMTQKSAAAPIVSRHQVTTDVTSIAKRELSVTRAVDYSSKFIRQGLEPYIGRYNITPQFLKLFNSVLVAQGLFLVRNGVLNDFKVASVKVDETAPDTILADIEILVKYPVNYIKIQLIF